MDKKYYGAIDGLRTFSCIGIALMHLKANNAYNISGYLYDTVVSSFTNFVFLFMVISAFGLCCGYYEKMVNNTIQLEDFYFKRYRKIFPFFAVLVLLDIAISPSVASLYEGFADLTLLFGFLPGEISVIGVGWFLGLIFVFYMIFPFFCVLLKNRKRAWGVFLVALLLNHVCAAYFEVGRHNIAYSFCYLLAGGLVYLYREELERLSRDHCRAVLAGAIASVVLYYAIGGNTITMLFMSVMFLTYALGRTGGVLQNRFTKFFGAISMEVYLSHMVVFRAIEKLHINTVLGDGWAQYCVTAVTVLVGATVFSVAMKNILGLASKWISSRWG